MKKIKMQLKLFLLLTSIIIILMSACQSNTSQKTQNDINPNTHKVKVEEVIHTSSYTYLRVLEESNDYWIAIPKRDVEEGKTYYYDDGMEMKNFKSKDLNRTFKTVYFVQEIRDAPIKTMSAGSQHVKPSSAEKKEISVESAEGGITIAELFSNRESYSKKTVIIKGEVVKINNGIMGKNWVHIQDGTNDSDNYDLTITTNEVVKVGDTITFEGTIALKKDFGAGYSYEVIMEEAKQQNK